IRVCCISRPRLSSNSLPSSASAAAVFLRTRRLVTSEMSDGSKWTCSGNRSIRRASSIFEPSSPLTSSSSFSWEVMTIQCLPRPLYAELLTDRLEVEHLLDVARNELSDLVDHEHERVAGLTPLHEINDTFGELARRDVGTADCGLRPSIGRRECLWLETMERP